MRYFTAEELQQTIPEGRSGINSERRTLLEILQNPFPQGYFEANILSDEKLSQHAKELLARWADEYSKRPKRIGEDNDENLKESGYGMIVAAPTPSQAIVMLREIATNSEGLRERLTTKNIDGGDIRNGVTYPLFRQALARELWISESQAARLIGRLDMAIHERPDGLMQMVPRNLHEWWPHRGYVSNVVEQINKML